MRQFTLNMRVFYLKKISSGASFVTNDISPLEQQNHFGSCSNLLTWHDLQSGTFTNILDSIFIFSKIDPIIFLLHIYNI